MNHAKQFLLFFILLQLITFTACSDSGEPSPYAFDYPEDFSPKYCFDNYLAFDANIRYTECYDFVNAKESETMSSVLTAIEYSAIKGSDDLSFIVCHRTIHWFGTNRDVYILRRKDCNIQPIRDYTPSKIELCTYDDLIYWKPEQIDVSEAPETYFRYAANTFSDPILTIEASEAIAEIMGVAQRPTTMTLECNWRENETFPDRYDLNNVLWQEKPVYVKISFEECAGLVWVGQLFTDDEGKAYMERFAYVQHEGETKEDTLFVDTDFSGPFPSGWAYPLGEHMDVILAELNSQS